MSDIEQYESVYDPKDIDFLASEAERRGVLIHINGLPHGAAKPIDWSGVTPVRQDGPLERDERLELAQLVLDAVEQDGFDPLFQEDRLQLADRIIDAGYRWSPEPG